jgi:hypothetical protein
LGGDGAGVAGADSLLIDFYDWDNGARGAAEGGFIQEGNVFDVDCLPANRNAEEFYLLEGNSLGYAFEDTFGGGVEDSIPNTVKVAG